MDESNLERHSEYECDQCGRKLKDLSEYNQHKLMHVLTPLCSNASNGKDSLKQPFRSDTGTTTDKCRQSESAFGTSSDLTGSGKLKSEKLEPFICLLCSMKFLSREQLKRHSHVCIGHKMHKCPHCKQPYSSQESVNRCMVSHNMGPSSSKTVSIKVGSTGTGNKKDFQTEPSKYFTERPFECTLCFERYTNPKSLELHVKRRHAKVDSLLAEYKRKKLLDELATKEYKCEVCSLRCRDEFTLQRHNDMYHADVDRLLSKYKRNDIPHKMATEEYECEICGSICTNALKLKSHKLLFHPISNDQRNNNLEEFEFEGSATYEPRPTISAGSTTHELERLFPAGSTPYGPLHMFSTRSRTFELQHILGSTTNKYSDNSLENEWHQQLFDSSEESENESPPNVSAEHDTDESNSRTSPEYVTSKPQASTSDSRTSKSANNQQNLPSFFKSFPSKGFVDTSSEN